VRRAPPALSALLSRLSRRSHPGEHAQRPRALARCTLPRAREHAQRPRDLARCTLPRAQTRAAAAAIEELLFLHTLCTARQCSLPPHRGHPDWMAQPARPGSGLRPPAATVRCRVAIRRVWAGAWATRLLSIAPKTRANPKLFLSAAISENPPRYSFNSAFQGERRQPTSASLAARCPSGALYRAGQPRARGKAHWHALARAETAGRSAGA